MAVDIFADIAAGGIGGRLDKLVYPEPLHKEEKLIYLKETTDTASKTLPKMSTKEELLKELDRQRDKYKAFLLDFAPRLESYRKRTYLKDFTYNGKEEVTLPHYGGPLGHATATYETNFVLDAVQKQQAAFICFKGADYKAQVYINGICAGMHEGFFSPFEFEITDYLIQGTNNLMVRLENDYIFGSNKNEEGKFFEGDKLYAATGLGYDDPKIGWHHCPPGMGIYNDVYIEIRNRIHISDIFVRPILEENAAEIWTEIYNCDYEPKQVELNISIYGQNFEHTVMENHIYKPVSIKTVGVGDSLTEAQVKAKGELYSEIPLLMKKGKNLIKTKIKIENTKVWSLETPYLYQVQVKVEQDTFKRQFGMRSFIQDTTGDRKGMFYLNGEKIRLRGANTMGFEQQDVLRKDFDSLIDDILLAKICNMNFFRLTQRPVQEEVYEYCDKLGLMTQTDLPLFGCMRRTQFCEGIRQAEEMEKLIRSHPCNVIISYINEPFPNANNQPHRHLERNELENFFAACDIVVKLNNPDRVIKHVDGDYDPPNETMPDNHCYPMWYNGHGIDIGRLHKGYWLAVKPGWYYGCGEYGAEGLDFAEVMREYYPKEWTAEPFHPNKIVGAQTGHFHYFFYDTQKALEDWVKESQKHQAFATRMMTEAFRRDSRMVTFAIHLFIDAWPSGWMKTIMDFKRNPKPAYFEYRNALEKVMLSLRADKFKYFDDEKINIESWLCNDTNNNISEDITYELFQNGKLIMKSQEKALCEGCDVSFNGYIAFTPPKVEKREKFLLKAILKDTYTEFEFEVFPRMEVLHNQNVIYAGKDLSKIDLAKEGKTVILEGLDAGEYNIAGETVQIKPCGMLPVHFLSRATGHQYVKAFKPDDFRMWFDERAGMITPLLATTFTCEKMTPVLTSGNLDNEGKWNTAMAVGEIKYGKGKVILCQLDLTKRLDNPVARTFYSELNR